MRAAEEMAALAGDFPEFDAALLACMVEDHGGDVAEVRAGLRVRAGAAPTQMSLCSRMH